MFYFSTRKQARDFAAMFQSCKVIDCKDNPNINGKRWGVKTLK